MSTSAEPAIRSRGTVRVSLPANVAYNPESLKQSIRMIVGRLGCGTCFSGADCVFQHEREFVVETAEKVMNPDPVPWRAQVALNPQPLPPGRSAVIALATPIRYDINKVFKAVDAVIKGLGACPCHSGIDVLYQSELPVLGVTENFEVQQLGV